MRSAFRLSHHPALRTSPSAPSARAEPGAGPDTARTAGLPGHVSNINSGRSLAQPGLRDLSGPAALRETAAAPATRWPGLTFAPLRRPSTRLCPRRRVQVRIEGLAQFCVPHLFQSVARPSAALSAGQPPRAPLASPSSPPPAVVLPAGPAEGRAAPLRSNLSRPPGHRFLLPAPADCASPLAGGGRVRTADALPPHGTGSAAAAPGSASAVCCLRAARFRAGAPAAVPLPLREPHPPGLGSGTLAFWRSGPAGVGRRRENARPPGVASLRHPIAQGCGRRPFRLSTHPPLWSARYLIFDRGTCPLLSGGCCSFTAGSPPIRCADGR